MARKPFDLRPYNGTAPREPVLSTLGARSRLPSPDELETHPPWSRVNDTNPKLTRRTCLRSILAILGAPLVSWPQQQGAGAWPAEDWVCPMDPDVRSGQAGVCPRCGMKLVLHVPEAVEYPLEISSSPDLVKPGDEVTLTFRVRDPEGRAVNRFEIVHERLMHIFIVSENLEFFAHQHPQPEAGGRFQLKLRLPLGGMYRLLADYYPAGSVPQLTVKTLFVAGSSPVAKLQPALKPSASENLTAALRINPEAPLAGLESKLFFTLEPAAGLEPYLGAWGHLLAVSDDLLDFLHVHPFLADGGPLVQFNLVFPRPHLYRVWAQFQRLGVVNTAVFTIPVKAL